MIGSVRRAVVLATHAALRNRWEDVQRLAFQRHSAFMLDWRKAPMLAPRHRHELFSSLSLLHGTECFTSCQQLDLNALLVKLVVGDRGLVLVHRTRRDRVSVAFLVSSPLWVI